MYSQFIRAIKWNTAGIIFYKIMLFAHQIFLYGAIPQAEYGIVGTIFSTIYFLIPVSNFGFDYTILAFFEKIKSTEEVNFVFKQYFYRACAVLGTAALAIAAFFYFDLNSSISRPLFFVCLALFLFENIKHSLRTHAHIFHLNKQIAIIENISLIGYVATIWVYFFSYNTISQIIIFSPLLVSSIVETLFIGTTLYYAYQKLPTQKATQKKDSIFFKESAYNYINQLAKALYSPNLLIIFLAMTVGFQKTGYIKFITNIIIFLYTIFYRSVHLSGGALLASISQMPQQLIKKTFNNIASYYTQILSTILIYLSGLLYLYAQKPPVFHETGHFSMYAIIIIFCLISFLEYGTLTYETLFVSQKKGKALAFINGVNILGAITFLGISCTYPHPGLLILFCLLKVTTTTYTILLATKIWHVTIRPSIDLTNLFIHATITLSLVSYFA